ncbi:Tumor-related protein [Mycena venus]|uniref:Tumor-related protein n=1 Tax=Mycena venus TaxID=2733690 RepID=A0A8H7CHQ3_9AGAR|nr:Tumor-related protein [Mycena venus]
MIEIRNKRINPPNSTKYNTLTMSNPNFPLNLDIRPSAPLGDAPNGDFDFTHQQEAIRVFGIAGKVWKAAYVLNTYINPPPDLIFDPPLFSDPDVRKNARIIELGAGTGIVAATMTTVLHTNDIMFVTDLPEVCPLLEQNLGRFLDGPIRVRPLSWAILSTFPNYSPRFFALFIQLSSPPFAAFNDDIEIIISYRVRSLAKETPFWSAFGLWFEFAPVLAKKTDPSDDPTWRRFGVSLEDPTFVFVARRRKESFGWQLPPSNEDLMQGVMAQGTLFAKER